MKPLTPRQQEVYDFIVDYMAQHNMPPTLREITTAINRASLTSAACHLEALDRKGFVARQGRAARSLHVVDPLAVLLRQINRLDKEQLAELKRRLP